MKIEVGTLKEIGAQHDAVIEISDNHGRFKACDLNIRMATVTAMAKRGWIGVDERGFAVITDAGWNAVSEI